MWTESKSGAHTGGGDMTSETRVRAEKIIEEFEVILKNVVSTSNIPPRLIRPMAPGSIVCGFVASKYFIGYLPQLGIPTITFMQLQATGVPSAAGFYSFLADRTAQDFCVVELDEGWLDIAEHQRSAHLTAIAGQVIQAELSRRKVNTDMIPFNPVFGQNIYPVQESLVFILMPFTSDLTAIYNGIVKPVVESKGMISRRADDISSNNAVMQDIWRSICEARFIVADITGRNPNVMYELGIAHTIGKEVILIHQIGDDSRFPFDIAHMRVITYENTATGGDALRQKVGATIESVMQKLGGPSIIK